jgi:acyl CoA:acetate/3-ketoacid CoA transferase
VTAGVGGFADITSNAPLIVFSGYFTAGKKDVKITPLGINVIKDGQISKFVKNVSQITFSGKRAVQNGQRVIYITERCVLELTAEGLMVIEIAPGIDLERDILQKADFKLLVSDSLKMTDIEIYEEPVMAR